MKSNILTIIALLGCIALFNTPVFAHEGEEGEHAHTSIGINADGISGTFDDNQLWIFAELNQQNWGTIDLLPTGEYIGDKQLFKAELDCWHSAEDVPYMLDDAMNQSIQPAWRIALQRVSFSSDFFWMENEATGLPILEADGDSYALASIWMDDEYNAAGELGVWGIHSHTEFCVLAEGAGKIFTAAFRAIDTANQYQNSEVYSMTFQTIPEPATIALLGLGALSVLRRRQ